MVGVFEIVERWETERPDREALVFGERSWTWAELADRVRRAAGVLREQRVSAGDRIAVLDKNHPVSLELAFAGSLVGAATTVINFRLAPDELIYVLGDCGAEVVVVGEEFVDVVDGMLDNLPQIRDVIVVGEDYERRIEAAAPVTDAATEDCFLQLYTSGTTGLPKGVLLTQSGMAAHTGAVAPEYAMHEAMVNVVAMPMFHVSGVAWALGSLSAGGRTVVVRDVAALLDEIETRSATHVFVVPAVLGTLLADEERVRKAFSTLEVLAYGGSPMPAPLIERVLGLSVPPYSVYGMTELSGAVCKLAPAEHADPAVRSSIGKPLPGNEIRIVDPATCADVEDGTAGELWVRSPQAMAGYWNLPEATAETLTPEGWLRTGDVVRRDQRGYLHVEDRVKDMVITGGENVYPAEVERVLIEHPRVAEVAVIGVPHARWGETLKAIVVPAAAATDGADGEIDGDELIAYARERLAHYKCPTSVAVTTELPRNPTGKILKTRLREQR